MSKLSFLSLLFFLSFFLSLCFGQTLSVSSSPGAKYGNSVSINNQNQILVGSPNDGNGIGIAYLFALSGQNWILEQQLNASAGGQPPPMNSGFGFAVSL